MAALKHNSGDIVIYNIFLIVFFVEVYVVFAICIYKKIKVLKTETNCVYKANVYFTYNVVTVINDVIVLSTFGLINDVLNPKSDLEISATWSATVSTIVLCLFSALGVFMLLYSKKYLDTDFCEKEFTYRWESFDLGLGITKFVVSLYLLGTIEYNMQSILAQ